MSLEMQVVLPASQVVELAAQPDGPVKSWIQVAKVGTFHSSRYGKFEISPRMLAEMVKNSEGSATRMMVDYDHLSLKPTAPEQAKAAGWFDKLETRNGGRELWGLVEWTPRAAELIANKEYQYISPTFVTSYKSKDTNADVGAKLLCAAITNHPFLEDMAPLQLAEVSMTEYQQRVHDAFMKRFNSGLEPTAYVVDTYEDHVIARKFEDGKLYRVDFSVTDDLEVTFNGEPVEVIATYEPVRKENGATSMADNKDPKDQNFVQLSEQLANLTTQVTTLSAALEGERTARVALEERAQRAELELSTERANRRVHDLLKEGKLLKTQEDWAKKYALSNPAEFEAFAATLQATRDLNVERGSGGDATAVQLGGDPVKELDEKILKYRQDHNCSYSEAMRAVSLSDPALAERYRAAMNSAVA